jgi:hypothetical protein
MWTWFVWLMPGLSTIVLMAMMLISGVVSLYNGNYLPGAFMLSPFLYIVLRAMRNSAKERREAEAQQRDEASRGTVF